METEINAFLASLGEYSESTRLAYANDLRVFLVYLQQNLDHMPQVADLNTSLVTSFLDMERSQGRQRSTLIRRLATLKYFREYLVERHEFHPAAFSIDDPGLRKVISQTPPSHSLQCLNADQVSALLEELEASPRPRSLRDRAIIMLMLESGLSVGILTGLNMTDLDLRAQRYHVRLAEKGDLWLRMKGATKPVSDYIAEGRPYLLHHTGEPALFISQMDGRLSRQGVWQILNFWGNLLKPPIPLSPRVLRHTAALRMSLDGMETTDIQVRLGHRNPLSTRALIRRLETACLETRDLIHETNKG